MKRMVLMFSLVALMVPGLVQAQQKVGTEWVWQPLHMRTSTANVVGQSNWTKFDRTMFLDSTVFRVGTLALTVVDTTQAIDRDDLAFPPNNAPLGYLVGVLDTTRTRWISIRVSQDTLSYLASTTLTSTAWDSIGVAAQTSDDGINWYTITGTPTRNYFDSPVPAWGTAVFQAGAEQSLGADWAQVDMACQPCIQAAGSAVPIINRTLCYAGKYIRFGIILATTGSGQFKVELGHWQ
jgi:hypothetical protein